MEIWNLVYGEHCGLSKYLNFVSLGFQYGIFLVYIILASEQ